MVLPLAEDFGQERQHVLRPDAASPPNSAEAVGLQILPDVLRVDLSGVRFSEPLELVAKNATRLQARILRRLNQKHGNLGFSRGHDEAALKQWIAIPAQRCRRDCHRCLIACATLSPRRVWIPPFEQAATARRLGSTDRRPFKYGTPAK